MTDAEKALVDRIEARAHGRGEDGSRTPPTPGELDALLALVCRVDSDNAALRSALAGYDQAKRDLCHFAHAANENAKAATKLAKVHDALRAENASLRAELTRLIDVVCDHDHAIITRVLEGHSNCR